MSQDRKSIFSVLSGVFISEFLHRILCLCISKMSACPLPNSDFETMKRQKCVYRADGKLDCGDFKDSISRIVNEDKTMFGPGTIQPYSIQKMPGSFCAVTKGSCPKQ